MSREAKAVFEQMQMLECLSLAERGAGYVSPNPMVGAVVVKEGKPVGKGYHRKFGNAHAEVYALRQAGSAAHGATLYVNLEPCCYHGKTPPCTELIIRSRIRKVVVGMKDPNPRVSGKSVRILREAGIEVRTGVLEPECKKLNEAFSKFVTTGLPFVTLKIAQTIDGRIADSVGRSRWISNAHSRTMAHALRARNDAVVVGANTVKQDDPRLTVRLARGRNPLRVVLDGEFSVPLDARMFLDRERKRTFVFVNQSAARRKKAALSDLEKRGVRIHTVSLRGNALDLRKVLGILAANNVASVLVEGGQYTYREFLTAKLVDKLVMFVSPKILSSGLPGFQGLGKRTIAGVLELHRLSSWNLHGDIMIEAYLRK